MGYVTNPGIYGIYGWDAAPAAYAKSRNRQLGLGASNKARIDKAKQELRRLGSGWRGSKHLKDEGICMMKDNRVCSLENIKLVRPINARRREPTRNRLAFICALCELHECANCVNGV